MAVPGTSWDVSCIPSLAGKVVVVTGANSGIGFVTALELVRKQAHVVLACRNPTRGEDAERRIREEITDEKTKVEFMRLDLSDLASVRAFAAAFLDKFDRLDILVNNAGLMLPEQTHTDSGLEMQFAVNYLGHFLLTQLLFDVLKRGESPSRVVAISSVVHRFARLDLATLARSQSGKLAYLNEYYCSKLANLLFTYELDRRVRAAGLADKVQAVAAHPGIVASELTHNIATVYAPKFLAGVVETILKYVPVLQETIYGALPTLLAATDPSVDSGSFFGPNGFATCWGKAPALEVSSSDSQSEELAAKLWQLSEQEAGSAFRIGAEPVAAWSSL
jgi:NAD(P)-dependent dehydrogenase (short-subunit alcohol dehydrogenase family)